MGWDSKEVADKILFAIGGTACQSNASYFPHFHILAGVLQQFVIHGTPGRPLFLFLWDSHNMFPSPRDWRGICSDPVTPISVQLSKWSRSLNHRQCWAVALILSEVCAELCSLIVYDKQRTIQSPTRYTLSNVTGFVNENSNLHILKSTLKKSILTSTKQNSQTAQWC